MKTAMATGCAAVFTGLATIVTAQDPGSPSKDSYAARTAAFWDWFTEQATQVHGMVGDPREGATLMATMSPRVEGLVPEMSWTFGPGTADDRHAFILSPEGNRDHQLLARYWLDRSPKLKGWEFHATKPPEDMDGVAIEVHGRQFRAKDFRIGTEVDVENEKIHVEVYHPAFADLPEEVRGTLSFLFLDSALGEAVVESWIGAIERTVEAPDAGSPSFETLNRHVRKILAAQEWNPARRPEAMLTLYRMPARPLDAEGRFPRDDVLTGITCHMELIEDYARSGGRPGDRLAGTGAAYAFVAFSRASLEPGKEAFQRGEIEEALEEATRTALVIGGAQGRENAYVDLLLFDPRAAIEEIRSALAKIDRVASARLHFFAGDAKPMHLK